MKLKEVINIYRKDAIFENYTRIINDFKDYEKISRNKIVDEIIKLYSDYNVIIDLCSNDELKLLKKILNNKISPQKIFEEELWKSLFDKFLLIHDNSDKKIKLVIPDEFKSIVKAAIKSYDEKEKIINDNLNILLIGIIKIYGALKINDYYNILKNYININKQVFINHISNNRYFKYYTYKVKYENDDYIIYEPYYSFDDDLLFIIDRNKNKFKYKIRPIEDVICLSLNRFDIDNPKINKFLEEIYKLNIYEENFLDKVLEFSVLGLFRDDLIDYLKSIPSLKNKNLDYLKPLMDDAMDEMPSASLKGMTPHEYMETMVIKNTDKKYKKVYNNIKDSTDINNYKNFREEVTVIYDDCYNELFKNKEIIKKFTNILNKNNIYIEEENILRSLLFYHKIDQEENIFEKVMKNKNILTNDYSLYSQFESSYIESLFQIKSLNPSLGQVTIKDVYTNKEYTIYDVALSCYDEVINKYMYTSLIKIGNYMFNTEYAFFINDDKNVLNIIKNEMNLLKDIKNNQTKKFLVCYKLFKKEDVHFTYRVLE